MDKTCVTCGVQKNLSQFYKDSSREGGLRAVCKLCQYTPTPRLIRDHKQASVRHLFCVYRNAAKFRALEFLLSEAQFLALIGQNCRYCGQQPTPFNAFINHPTVSNVRRENAWIVRNGIDRTDNAVGYTVENCVAACTQCNYARQDYTVEEFLAHCAKITKYQEKQNGVQCNS